MSACEWCWRQAQRRALLCGGSVTERYTEILAEQDRMGALADCPERRSVAGLGLPGAIEGSDEG